MKLDTERVIRYLLAAMREELEDDGDLVASKFLEALNLPATINYDAEDDKIDIVQGTSMVRNSLSDEAKAILGMR
jgi:hypothetical protein